MRALLSRIARFNWSVLICIDQLGQTLFVGLWWVATSRGHCPDPDETISAYVGRGMLREKIWARFFGAMIDTLFFVLTGQRNHCVQSVGQ